MKVALINPNNLENAANVPFLQKGLLSSWNAKAYSPPLNLCMVAAYTPEDIGISITDECVEPVDFEKDVDLVGITSYTNNAPRAYEIADAFSLRGIPVVMGGVHTSNLPDEALEHCNAVVIGEAEGSWQKLVSDFSKGRLDRIYRNEHLADLKKLPIPRRDLLRREGYVTTNTVQTTRGCPHNCSFCSVTRFNGRSYRFRPVPEVIREMESLDSRNVFIIDDNIFGDRDRSRELLEAMMPLRLKWGSQSTISIAKDPELLDLAARSGCIGLAIGLESFSRESLIGAHKRFNNPGGFYRDIETIKSYGILIWGSFVLGFDQDDEEGLEKTLRMASSSRLDFACFNFLTPLPGTRIHNSLLEEDRLITKDWSQYNMANLVFKPLKVRSAVLEEKVKRAWLEFYSIRSLFNRLSFPRSRLRWFIWFVNLALFFYTRKKLKWEKN